MVYDGIDLYSTVRLFFFTIVKNIIVMMVSDADVVLYPGTFQITQRNIKLGTNDCQYDDVMALLFPAL